jgi:hypothetical protein
MQMPKAMMLAEIKNAVSLSTLSFKPSGNVSFQCGG